MSQRPKILIVDDEPRLCHSLKAGLGSRDYEIVVAYSGKEAVELLNERSFDLILLDVVMPEMSGYQVMDYMYEAGLETQVILMTGYAPTEMTEDTRLQGAYGYLVKPFDLAELLAAVEDALRKKRAKNDVESGP